MSGGSKAFVDVPTTILDSASAVEGISAGDDVVLSVVWLREPLRRFKSFPSPLPENVQVLDEALHLSQPDL